ncbi:E3 ubiquitin-protein ligase [Tetrabaena socialis]|uniref:E3 ubiquitin-protein ligase n=1 Tax=Tetrabaena socialis TaxID=47790 RepID=A0A2J8A7K9_9CHLO|nr:E3 ubiquitin-protein ligase [Tetrabaena socialis]|eukprot:PNH08470.1 E3 ubiquitin-protein ligase [Tetrabaena socialis]
MARGPGRPGGNVGDGGGWVVKAANAILGAAVALSELEELVMPEARAVRVRELEAQVAVVQQAAAAARAELEAAKAHQAAPVHELEAQVAAALQVAADAKQAAEEARTELAATKAHLGAASNSPEPDAAPEPAPTWDAGDVVTSENWRLGGKVVRGPDWQGGDADGGKGGVGTIVGGRYPDYSTVAVEWEHSPGESSSCRCGADDKYDLRCAVLPGAT